MTTERKPCPFCGQDSGRLFTANDGGQWVECTMIECATEGPLGGWEAWNKRGLYEVTSVTLPSGIKIISDPAMEPGKVRLVSDKNAGPQARIYLNKDRWKP